MPLSSFSLFIFLSRTAIFIVFLYIFKRLFFLFSCGCVLVLWNWCNWFVCLCSLPFTYILFFSRSTVRRRRSSWRPSPNTRIRSIVWLVCARRSGPAAGTKPYACGKTRRYLCVHLCFCEVSVIRVRESVRDALCLQLGQNYLLVEKFRGMCVHCSANHSVCKQTTTSKG